MSLCVRLVEDNESLIELLTRVLAAHTDQIELVVTDKDFASLLEREPWRNVDVALVDILLGEPDIDGRDILRWLATERPDIRRVVFSAVGNVYPELEELAHVVITKGSTGTVALLFAIGVDPDA